MKMKGTLLLLLLSLVLHGKKSETISSDAMMNTQQVLTDQTNLALRQLGHQLLLLEGNDSVAIMPIQQANPHTFLLPIAQSFYYDTLPFLLHTALTDLDITQESYYVAVKDCVSDTLILGYDARQFKKGRVPCIGREQYVACNHIYVTFPDRAINTNLSNNKNNWLHLLFLPALLGFGVFYLLKNRKSKSNLNSPKNKPLSTNPSNELLTIGQSQLDVTNQFLYVHKQPISLTFRETKLFHYFVQHAGQLLTREQLLENVWEEEGIIVGRSLDVFVSRLRKILKADASLMIKTVHGVGYRLEVKYLSGT